MKKLFIISILAVLYTGIRAQDTGIHLDQSRIVGLGDTIKLCLRNGFYCRVLLPTGDTTDLATIFDLNNLNATINSSLGTLTPRFDSIKVAASNPSVGNIYVSSVDNRVHFKNGNYWYRLGVLDSTIITSPLLANLAAYYKFDESSGAVLDATGMNNATVSGGVTRPVTGEIGTAYQLDGSSGMIYAPNIDTAGVFTYAMWIKSTYTTYQTFITTNSSGPYWGMNGNGTMVLAHRNVGDVGSSTGTINSGAWTHIAVTFDAGGNYVFYINGVVSGTGNNPTTYTFGSEYLIGSFEASGFVNGTIDELAIYKNRVLTQSEINLLMNKTYPFN